MAVEGTRTQSADSEDGGRIRRYRHVCLPEWKHAEVNYITVISDLTCPALGKRGFVTADWAETVVGAGAAGLVSMFSVDGGA